MFKDKTSNPAFTLSSWETHTSEKQQMTEGGAFSKTILLFFVMMATFLLTTKYFIEMESKGFGVIGNVLLCLTTLGVVIFACTKPKLSPILAPIYASLEGVFLGQLVLLSEYILESLIVTTAIFFTFLVLYRTRIIRVSNWFIKITFGLTLGVLVFYLIEMFLILLNITDGSLVFGNGIISLIVAAFCLFVAVSNLLVDFWMIEDGSERGLAKYMEFYFAMSLLISIVWIYVEVLRIFKILNND